MEKEEPSFKRIDTPNDQKLKYEGYCSKCQKPRPHRFEGGSLYENRYRCMKCGNITITTTPIT